jgi:acyl carrier protein
MLSCNELEMKCEYVMDKQQVLRLLDELLELNPGTLQGDEPIQELGGWNSLAVLGLISIADEKFGKILSPSAIYQAKTVQDIIKLLI